MSKGLRLAVVNWRDPWHPSTGGAERYAWELARRFAREGDRVHYVTARAPGQERGGRVEGVEFVRLGGRFTVYPLVLLWMLRHRRRFDAVIDCQNGIPFFTPWVLPRRVPVFCVIHHVHTAQFGLYFPRWLAWLGQMLEGPVSRWTYRRHAYVVVSESTLRAVRERLGWTGTTHVVHNGTSVAEPDGVVAEPAGDPGLVCVTRLVPHKRLHLLLDLAQSLAVTRPGLKLHIVGDGPEAPALKAAIGARGLDGVVVMHGYVPENVKAALVARADLHLSSSQSEGWGLSVIEAAALGVPTVAFDVDGLRDAVRDGITGWLVRDGDDLRDCVERALKELDDPTLCERMATECQRWAAHFDWSRTAAQMHTLINQATRGTAGGDAADREAPDGAAPDREADGRDAPDRVADDRDTADPDAAGREATDGEAGGRDAADREVGEQDAGEREASGWDAADREVGGREAADRDAASERDAGEEDADERDA